MHLGFWAHGAARRLADVPGLRRRDPRTTAASRIATSRSSIRPARCPSSSCRPPFGELRDGVRVADGGVRRRARRGRRRDQARGGVLRRARAGARGLADPLALRPLAGAAHGRCARCAAARAARARLGAARRGGRGQALAARARPARARLVVPRGRSVQRSPGSRSWRASSCRSRVVAPHGLWDSLSGQASRPLQIESLGASLFTTFGHPSVISSHGSQNVAGHGAVAAVFALLQIAALVALWIAFARGPATGDRLLRYSAAAVCAFIAFGKVLSPQYLLWLIPLVPLVRGPPRPRRDGAADGRARADAGLVPAALLGLRRRVPQRRRRARARPRARGAARRARLAGSGCASGANATTFSQSTSDDRGGVKHGAHAAGERGRGGRGARSPTKKRRTTRRGLLKGRALRVAGATLLGRLARPARAARRSRLRHARSPSSARASPA